MFYVNGSAIADFEQCRFRYWAKWIMNRVERNEAPALSAGRAIHKIFEKHHTENYSLADASMIITKEWRDLLDKETDEREKATGEKALKVLTDIGEGWNLWKDKYEFEIPVLEVEQPFEITFKECPDVIFRGRPDRVAVMNNMTWHIQNRGLAAGTNFGIYIATAKRHRHEHIYAEHLAMKYPKRKYGGTVFNLLRKLKYRTKMTKTNPLGETKTANELYFQHPLSINLKSGLHKHVMLCTFQHVRDMIEVQKRWEQDEEIPAPNEKLNAGVFGNMVDPFFRVLTGEITLDDNDVFKDRTDTYAPTETLED